MATSVIEKLLVNIEANAAQLQAELAKAGKSTQDFGRTTSAMAKGADGIGQRYSVAAVQIASAAENMARAGKLGGEGLKQIIVQGSNMAFMFGAQGAVVGAVGIASLAIIEFFRKARDETQKLAEQTKRALDEMQNRGDAVGLTERARVLFEGTPAAGFADGIKALRREYEALGRTLDELKRKGGDVQAQLASQFGTAGAAAAKIGTSGAGALGSEFAKVKKKYDAVAAQLQAAEAEFREIQRKVQAPGPSSSRTVDPIRTTVAPLPNAADAKRSADEATREAAVMRDLTQAFDDLFAKAREGDVSLADFDRAMRELGDGFRDKIKTPTEAQSAAFATLATKAGAVREALEGIGRARLADEFAAMMAALTPTVLDDVAVKLKKLRAELTQKGFSQQQVADLLALEQAYGDVAIGMEQLEAKIAGIKKTAISSFDAQLGLTGLLQETEQQLRALQNSDVALAGDPEAAIRIQGLIKQVEALRQAIAELNGEAAKGRLDPATEQRALAKAQQLGRTIDDIGRLTLAAADAFGVMSDEASKALAAAFDVGAGIGRIALGDAKGGGAQATAGIVSLLGQWLGKDPETAQRKREHQENLQALREIAKNTGDLLGVTQSGRDIAGIRSAVGDLLARTGDAGGFRRFGDKGPLRNVDEAALLEAQTGLAFKQIEALAKSLGVTLNGTKQSYIDFLDALRRLDLEAFTRGFAGQIRRLELEARLDPQAFEGLDGLLKRIEVLTGPDGAPALSAALAGLDLTTSEGRTEAIARLGEVLRNISALDVADLGGLSLDEFIEEILSAVEQLRALDPTPADKFAKAIEAFGTAVELGSMTAEEKLDKAKALFADLFPDLAASVDTSSVEAFKSSIQSIIDGFAADGELTEAEQAQIAVLRLMIEAFDGASAAAADIAQKAEAAMLAARALVFSIADALIAVNDISDPVEILKIRAAALVKAFPELSDVMAQFDLSTQEGRDALEAWIQSLIASPDALAAMAKELGISVDDLLGRLLGLESAADDAAVAVETLADKLGAAFDSAEFDLELEGITDPLEKLKRTSAAIGDVLPDIADIFKQFDVATEEGRAGAEAALIALAKSTDDAAVRSAVLKLLGQIRGIKGDETAPAAGLAGGGGGGGGRDNVRATAAITEVTANRLVDLFGRNVVATEQMRDTLAAALGRTLALPGAIAPPALPSLLPGASAASAGGAGAGAVVLQLTLPQIVFNGPVTTANEAELARLIQSRFMDLIQSQLTTELLVAIRRAGVARSN